ncbi:hypothetical protein GALMADRAFT_254166 [Galerina marginata CBS 339.88]|uniref:Uncharacterized protein n=1 Tax=Galerina marginata (strain CBS 339.88) TaxID=685588 RepID=A0A067SKC7_GALM3|nr:hypothetical protein GALMADRAFT_254166 [Galerina marginata CBS 339.88]
MDDGVVALHTLWKRDIWRVQISSGTDSYSITHVETSKRLLCTYPDPNRKDIATVGVHIPNAPHTNPGWNLIPK